MKRFSRDVRTKHKSTDFSWQEHKAVVVRRNSTTVKNFHQELGHFAYECPLKKKTAETSLLATVDSDDEPTLL